MGICAIESGQQLVEWEWVLQGAAHHIDSRTLGAQEAHPRSLTWQIKEEDAGGWDRQEPTCQV